MIVDNSMVCFAYHLNNGIPIPSWFDNWEDREVIELVVYYSIVIFTCYVNKESCYSTKFTSFLRRIISFTDYS